MAVRLPVVGIGMVLAALAGGCASESEPEAAASTDQDLYSADKLPQEVNRRVERCFQRSYAHDAFSVARTTDVWGGKRVINFDGEFWDLMTTAYDGLASVFLLRSNGAQVLHELTTDLQGTADEQHLTDDQKVEMVMCVTSNLISYDYEALAKNADTNARTPELAVEMYKGVCANFSRIAVRLLNDIGVRADLQSGELYAADGRDRGLHAWVGVHLPSRHGYYWVEPQDDPTVANAKPTFFNPQPE